MDVGLGKVRHESKHLAITHVYTEKKGSIEWMCKQLEISKTETFTKAIGGNPGAKPIFHSD